MSPSYRSEPTREAVEADRELVRRALAGEAEAREAFARRMRCVPRILQVLNGRRGAPLLPHDLEDLAQDTIVRILQKLGTARLHTTLEFWAHRFCYLELMNRIRSQGRRSAIVASGFEGDAESDESEQPILEPGELERWLDRMEPNEAEAIRLRLFEHLDFDQIGARFGVPAATAKSRYYRGIAWLQLRLGSMQKRYFTSDLSNLS
jgi:RNA polymerase sigma-70 factor (ECF subfamily)